jgi:FKBP-type peptidyl-prolyl cis-trans isomerase FklB
VRQLFNIFAAFLFSLAATVPAHANYAATPEGNAQFLAAYGAQADVTKLPDGLMYRVLEAGKGPKPLARQDIVTVEYSGMLIDGTVFDKTQADEPRSFQAGGLIPGWTEALFKMKTGDEWEIVVPAALAYGVAGHPPAIPPNQTLFFRVKLVKVEYP